MQTNVTLLFDTILRRHKTYTSNKTIYIQKSFDIVHIHFSNSWVFLSFKNPTLPIQLSRYPMIPMYPSIKTRISGLCERVSPALVVPQFGLSRGNMAMPTAIGFTKKLPLDFAYVFLWCVIGIGFSCLMLKWFIGCSYNTSLFVVWYGFLIIIFSRHGLLDVENKKSSPTKIRGKGFRSTLKERKPYLLIVNFLGGDLDMEIIKKTNGKDSDMPTAPLVGSWIHSSCGKLKLKWFQFVSQLHIYIYISYVNMYQYSMCLLELIMLFVYVCVKSSQIIGPRNGLQMPHGFWECPISWLA